MPRQPHPAILSFAEVREQGIHLDAEFPIYVRHGLLEEGQKADPPLYHPFLEFLILLRGEGEACVEGKPLPWRSSCIFFGGIGLPHWARIDRYPLEFVSVYFLPSILSEWGDREESLAVLNRFFAPQPPQNRIVHPPPELVKRLAAGFLEMGTEFERSRLGWKIKLQSLLIGMLVDLIRWEHDSGRTVLSTAHKAKQWEKVLLAMRYIREHFAEPVYAPQVAAAANMSVSGLKAAFNETIRMPWVQYLRSHRIYRASLLLQEGNHNVTEVALASGFQSLSHFNRTYKAVTGRNPTKRGPAPDAPREGKGRTGRNLAVA